ncbi:putative nucleic acid-binding protein [Sphingobium wenxiniae]|uniref:Putative nucleic acid-binding protein n=1 Tax=Sphingobium wenxiniae (strain DSM 21828 / CGMCC 1.7748 / JZ-1) TaxID=595605 RepID=A0A562K4D1_SPHWJ|nr:type II toxin-antitoxin system VapC family toxin [Sphingobium wenxiniae]MBB6193067.1 putative nucleic acid-binding protein [Sphingobium wenxiniae]TWH90299.1 putative nucleic acid-binding protein [Sphingobium wenxiniae]
MSCIIINDASALIDLKKGELLHVLGALPFRWIVPLPIREEEMLSFSGQDWATLEAAGFEIFDLPPDMVGEAFAVRRAFPRLSANDCFCLVSAVGYKNAVLLTGDAELRSVAQARDVEVHGVLWILDHLCASQACDVAILRRALTIWSTDPAVRLPQREITIRQGRLS